ncbi:MAG: HAMP domain-containing histidine kinase [Firmicutes bacterium]|nr:HAMP domain-containing histidine kinase [Bacillota bacterium]
MFRKKINPSQAAPTGPYAPLPPFPKQRFRFGIRPKMFLGLLVVFIASVLLLNFILTKQLSESMEDQIQSDLVKLRNNTEVYVRQVMLLEGSPDLSDPSVSNSLLPALLDELYDTSGFPLAFYNAEQTLLHSTHAGFFSAEFFPEEAFQKASTGTASYQLRYDMESFCYAKFVMPICISDDIIGYLLYHIDYTDLQLEKAETTTTVLQVTIMVMAVTLLFSILLLTHFTTPLGRLMALTSRFKEQGVSTQELQIQKETLARKLARRHDEIGHLSQNYAEMLDTIQRQLNLIQQDRNRIFQLLSSKQAFFDNVTHELKTPLTTIQGYAQLIQDNGTSDPELLQTGLDHILNESARLHTMVLQLLEMSNVKNTYELHSLNLTALLVSVTEAMELKANRYQSHLNLTCPEHLPVHGQEDRLRQLVINLIDNAIKYGAPQKTIEISAGRRQKDLSSSFEMAKAAHQKQDFVYLQVKNEGKGMTPEQAAHIFEPFYRVDKNYSREQGSSGLGLAICQKIAQEHQAHIEVNSAPEGPTIFTVWFAQEEVKEDEI